MAISREISNFERGMLVGIPIGAIAGPSVALVLFVLIVCYDLGRPRIVDVGQRLIDKYIGIDVSQPSSLFDSGKEEERSNVISEDERTILTRLLSRVNKSSTPYRDRDRDRDEGTKDPT